MRRPDDPVILALADDPDVKCPGDGRFGKHRIKGVSSLVSQDEMWLHGICIGCGNLVWRNTSLNTEHKGGLWHRRDGVMTDYEIEAEP